MLLSQVINLADGLKPNAFTNGQKTQWINECEGLVQTEVLLMSGVEIFVYDYELDRDTELMVHPPHDKIYLAYLIAMIDFANGEYEKYQNSMELFNAHLGEYSRFIARTFAPANFTDF